MKYNTSIEKFAERLRMEIGLSFRRLSKATKELASVCRWGNRQADVKCIQRVILAKFFNVTIESLMGLED